MSARRKVINKLVKLFTKGDDVANAYRPGYVYKTVNTVDGMKYIGSKLGPKGHKGTYFNEKYYGSGSDLNKAIDKYGIDKFINVKQLDTRTVPGLKKAEQGLLNTVGARQDPMYYNKHNHYSGAGDVSDATKKKLSDSGKLYNSTNNSHNLGKVRSQEVKDKMSKSMKGIPKSEAHKNKIRNTLTGRKHTPETIEKLKKLEPWNKGKKIKPISKEQKIKQSKAMKGKPAWNTGMTKEEQVTYRQTKGLL
jgi:hypothetical protein